VPESCRMRSNVCVTAATGAARNAAGPSRRPADAPCQASRHACNARRGERVSACDWSRPKGSRANRGRDTRTAGATRPRL